MKNTNELTRLAVQMVNELTSRMTVSELIEQFKSKVEGTTEQKNSYLYVVRMEEGRLRVRTIHDPDNTKRDDLLSNDLTQLLPPEKLKSLLLGDIKVELCLTKEKLASLLEIL